MVKNVAEKRDATGMLLCAFCYHVGQGVDQSNEQAIYWYEKYLEIEDNELVRHNLQTLRARLDVSGTAGSSQEPQPTYTARGYKQNQDKRRQVIDR